MKMQRQLLFAGTAAIAMGVLLTLGSMVVAQVTAADTQIASRNRIGQNQQGMSTPMNVRASQLIGKDIENEAGKSVGEVNDIVLDTANGRIRYAAVTYGGFLGIGDKMFAVPWEAFQCHQDKDDADEHHLVLNVTQQQLDGAQGFDQDHWPNFTDRNWTMELDRRYKVDRNKNRNRNRNGVNVDVDRGGGVDVDVNRNN